MEKTAMNWIKNDDIIELVEKEKELTVNDEEFKYNDF